MNKQTTTITFRVNKRSLIAGLNTEYSELLHLMANDARQCLSKHGDEAYNILTDAARKLKVIENKDNKRIL